MQGVGVRSLEPIFNRSKPKSKFVAEMHVEDEIDSISKEIINGDILINRRKTNLNQYSERTPYDEVLRRRYKEHIDKEKGELMQRLSYIENAEMHLDKYRYLKRRGSAEDIGEKKGEEWRKEFETEMKRLSDKKKEVEERKKEKEREAVKLRQSVKEAERTKKKAQLEQSLLKLKENTEKRQELERESRQRVRQLLGKKQLYTKMDEKYREQQKQMVEEREQKIAALKALNKPIDHQEIFRHQQELLQRRKQLQKERKRRAYQNARNSSYHAPYQSAFYKEIVSPSADEDQEEPEGNPRQKIEKMKQFGAEVKLKHAPEVSSRKRKEMKDRLEKEVRDREEKEQRDKDLLEESKRKGLEYLEGLRNLPRRNSDVSMSARMSVSTSDRITYKNYIPRTYDGTKAKPFQNMMKGRQRLVDAAELMRSESQRIEERLKRKQQRGRVLGAKAHAEVDQEYYQMVKEKLNLLERV